MSSEIVTSSKANATEPKQSMKQTSRSHGESKPTKRAKRIQPERFLIIEMKTKTVYRLLHFSTIALIVSAVASRYFGFESLFDTDCNMLLCFKHQHSLEFYHGSAVLLSVSFVIIDSINENIFYTWITGHIRATIVMLTIALALCATQVYSQPFEFGVLSYNLNEQQLNREYRTLLFYLITYVSVVLIIFTESRISRHGCKEQVSDSVQEAQ